MNRLHLIKGPSALPPQTSKTLNKRGFNGQTGQGQSLTQPDGSNDLYLGLGDGEPIGFWTGAEACRAASGNGSGPVTLINPEALSRDQQQTFALAWLLESYRYGAFKAVTSAPALEGVTPATRTLAVAAGLGLTRDLINTPANHMRPGDLAKEARDLAEVHNAQVAIVSGNALANGFPLIDAVGRAAGDGAHAARLIDLSWGAEGPELILVGKGITFDSGGLNLKPSGAMRLMKKDMGGAAHVLGLAHMIMALDLPLRLRVLIPAAENSLGTGAFHPGDVLPSRAGLSVEIDNTDAEGRLVLADALTYARERANRPPSPRLLITMATLTGAARVALGPEIAPFFSNRPEVQSQLMAASAGLGAGDPLWPLPLFAPYQEYLKSDLADLANAGGAGFAGAVSAALFLQRFIDRDQPWAHFDVYGWNPAAKPGRPKGGAAQGLMALLNAIEAWLQNPWEARNG